MSETPDAPPEVAQEAAPPTEGAPEVSPAPEEGGDFDIATLPEQAQNYIKELREENRDRRKAHDPYKIAFSGYTDGEKEYLLDMVDTLGVDQTAGGQKMLDLAQRMLGIEVAAEETVADAEVQEEAAAAGLSPEEVAVIVKEQVEQERLILEVQHETKELGIDPNSEEAYKLWDLAHRLQLDDLSKVLEISNQMNGIVPEAPAEEAAPETGIVSDGRQAEFPVTAGVQTGSGGTNADEKAPIPALGSDELRARVLRRIEEASVPG